MGLQTTTSIYISEREITSFKSIKLSQELATHHTLELVCRMDVLEDLTEELGSSSKNFLGEVITLQIGAAFSFQEYQQELEFSGVVAEVKTLKGHELSSGDDVIIIAKSPSYLADDGPHYTSYNDTSLSEIIETSFQGYDTSKLSLLIEPKNDTTIHYSVQHNESAFEYAKRLAAQYGEWFYYNGSELVFGKLDNKELNLTYGYDLIEYQLSLQPKSHNYKFYTNDYLLDEIHEKDAKDISAGASGYNGFVSKKANTIFNKETKVWYNLYDDPTSKQRLDTNIELQKKAIEIQQVQVNGVSDNPGVKLGNIVIIEGASYRITKVTHINEHNGNYQNKFEAVTATFDAYPNTDINAFPKCETQTAVVIENADPEGLGRIQVQFPWQKLFGGSTPWLRIVSPHAGGDKGFHFIPETGEEVLVGFEGGNAEQPYVMGSLYNGSGKASSFMDLGNAIKALQTRSGNKVIMNDKDGSVTIADPSGNVVALKGNGEITIKAPKKLSLISTDINILAGNSINIAAKPSQQGLGEGIINVLAQKSMTTVVKDETLSFAAKQDVTIESVEASTNLKAKADMKIKGKDLKLTAKNELVAHGSSKSKISGGKVEINKG